MRYYVTKDAESRAVMLFNENRFIFGLFCGAIFYALVSTPMWGEALRQERVETIREVTRTQEIIGAGNSKGTLIVVGPDGSFNMAQIGGGFVE